MLLAGERKPLLRRLTLSALWLVFVSAACPSGLAQTFEGEKIVKEVDFDPSAISALDLSFSELKRRGLQPGSYDQVVVSITNTKFIVTVFMNPLDIAPGRSLDIANFEAVIDRKTLALIKFGVLRAHPWDKQ